MICFPLVKPIIILDNASEIKKPKTHKLIINNFIKLVDFSTTSFMLNTLLETQFNIGLLNKLSNNNL